MPIITGSARKKSLADVMTANNVSRRRSSVGLQQQLRNVRQLVDCANTPTHGVGLATIHHCRAVIAVLLQGLSDLPTVSEAMEQFRNAYFTLLFGNPTYEQGSKFPVECENTPLLSYNQFLLIIEALSENVFRLKKLARLGMLCMLVMSVLSTYVDLITDILLIIEFYSSGNM